MLTVDRSLHILYWSCKGLRADIQGAQRLPPSPQQQQYISAWVLFLRGLGKNPSQKYENKKVNLKKEIEFTIRV